MKKKTVIIIAIILLIIVSMQFIPVERPEYSTDNPNDLIKNNEIPEEISTILKNACYDCHSNETDYPWYSRVYPVKLLVYEDINEGRDELNFSNWEADKKIDRAGLLDDIAGEVLDGEMPMKIYTLMHTKAKLSEEQRNALASWTEEFADGLFE